MRKGKFAIILFWFIAFIVGGIWLALGDYFFIDFILVIPFCYICYALYLGIKWRKPWKAKQKRVSKIPKQLPSNFLAGIPLPRNKIICPVCGKGDKIYALYGGENTRYGCNWCSKVFT